MILNPSSTLHLDAHAFFASVEQVVNPELKGKPVVEEYSIDEAFADLKGLRRYYEEKIPLDKFQKRLNNLMQIKRRRELP